MESFRIEFYTKPTVVKFVGCHGSVFKLEPVPYSTTHEFESGSNFIYLKLGRKVLMFEFDRSINKDFSQFKLIMDSDQAILISALDLLTMIEDSIWNATNPHDPIEIHDPLHKKYAYLGIDGSMSYKLTPLFEN